MFKVETVKLLTNIEYVAVGWFVFYGFAGYLKTENIGVLDCKIYIYNNIAVIHILVMKT